MATLTSTQQHDIAIIGAGMAGLTAARILRQHGLRAQLFDKGRGVGGRMSTRRAAERVQFDHGAQYFSAQDDRFRTAVEGWLAAGVAARWQARLVDITPNGATPKTDQPERFVGIPGMNAVAKHLATELDVRCDVRIARLERDDVGWTLFDESDAVLGRFSRVLVTAPAPQARELLQSAAPNLADRLGAVEIAPCWAVMAAFEQRIEADFDAAFVHDYPLSWVARDAAKPGRGPAETWVLHGSPDWSRAHLERPREEVAAMLVQNFGEIVQRPDVTPSYVAAHRWRYALPTALLDERCIWDQQRGLGVAGDWCAGPRVEGAFLSGLAAAEAIVRDA